MAVFGISLSPVCHSYFQWICSFWVDTILCNGYIIFVIDMHFFVPYKIKPFPSGHIVHTFQISVRIGAKNCISTQKTANLLKLKT